MVDYVGQVGACFVAFVRGVVGGVGYGVGVLDGVDCVLPAVGFVSG